MEKSEKKIDLAAEAIRFLDQSVPEFFCRKRNQIATIVFTALFALIFINLYEPFGSMYWKAGITQTLYTVYSSLLVLAGMAIVVISRVAMTYYSHKHKIQVWKYIMWVGVELLLMSTIYTICSVQLSLIPEPLEAFRVSLKNTALVLLLPYAISIIFGAWRNNSRLLSELAAKMGMAAEQKEAHSIDLISFRDEKGEVQLSVKRDKLLYIESADNYVCVWYMNGTALKRTLVRTTMKDVAARLCDKNILRSHRSYIVNMDQVKVVRREKDGVFLELGIEGVQDIPISKTYADTVFKSLLRE